MEPLLSVIIPVYNVEKFLDRCLESVTKQTYRNLEIIIVDDGTKDCAGKMADEWAKTDNRINVIHQENQGLSAARNTGIDHANGEYITFVDSDDYLELDTYEKVMQHVVDDDTDIGIFPVIREEPGKEPFITRKPWFEVPYAILDKEQMVQQLLLNRLDCAVWNKVFSRKLFTDLRFKKGITNEDFALLYKLMNGAEKAVYILDAKYHYMQNGNSITTTAFGIKQFDKYENCLEMLDYIKKYLPECLDEAYYYLWYHSFCLLKHLYVHGIADEYKEYSDRMRTTIKKSILLVASNKHLTYKEKLMYAVMAYSPKLYLMIHGG